MLIKHLILLAVFLILSLSPVALAAEPGSGAIQGQLVNATKDGSSVAAQDVTLTTYLNDAEMDSATTKTDAEGRFVFDGLSTGPGYGYQAKLDFQGVEYNSEWLIFDEGEIAKPVEITVYDSTTSDEAIKVAMSHMIVYIEPGVLLVKEFYLFVNEADRTYIGLREVDADTKETLRFSLPDEATELQPTSGLMECCIYTSDDGFIDTMPILPGPKEVTYSYKVNYDSGTHTFSRRINYPTDSFNFLVQGEGIEVAADQLTAEEPLNIDGVWFNHFSGGDFTPGDTLVAQLSGLPETASQGTLTWVALMLAVLTGSFGFGYLLKRRRLQPVSTKDSPDQKIHKLLVELARLEDDFEDGKIEEEIYRKLRTAKKTQLVELMQEAKEEKNH